MSVEDTGQNGTKTKTVALNLRLPVDLHEKLKRRALLDDRSLSNLIIRALREWTNEREPAPLAPQRGAAPITAEWQLSGMPPAASGGPSVDPGQPAEPTQSGGSATLFNSPSNRS